MADKMPPVNTEFDTGAGVSFIKQVFFEAN